MHTATPGKAIRLTHEYRGRIYLLMTDVVIPEMNGRYLAKILLPNYPDIQRLFVADSASSSRRSFFPLRCHKEHQKED
jgi:hypothetical protein